MMKNSKIYNLVLTTTLLATVGMTFVACGSKTADKSTVAEAPQTVAEEIITEAELKLAEVNITEKDSVEKEIKPACICMASYDTYNIQVDPAQVCEDFMKEEYVGMKLKMHTVVPADESLSENGKYDAVDTVYIAIDGANSFDVLPQTMSATVEYKREAETLNWVMTNSFCTDWSVDRKSIGGSAWKLSTDDGEVYIRMRDTVEFMSAKVDPTEKSLEKADFDTTILGVYATVKDGEVVMQRMHILSGTVSLDGSITIKMMLGETGDTTTAGGEELEVTLTDFEKIEKSDLPFTEEEFREVSDQLG